MPAKHTARPLGPARFFLSAAAAVLVMLVVWIAVRAVGPVEAAQLPTVVLPASSSPSPSPSPSPTPSAAVLPPSPSLSSRSSARPTATSHSPKPSSTTSRPTPTRTTSAGFSATVSVTASWDQGYVASVRVQNTGKTTAPWTVTVSHANLRNLRLLGIWGTARGTQSGDNVVFTGAPLAPGASAGFGYQVSATGRGNTRPSGCSVVGGRCGVS